MRNSHLFCICNLGENFAADLPPVIRPSSGSLPRPQPKTGTLGFQRSDDKTTECRAVRFTSHTAESAQLSRHRGGRGAALLPFFLNGIGHIDERGGGGTHAV